MEDRHEALVHRFAVQARALRLAKQLAVEGEVDLREDEDEHEAEEEDPDERQPCVTR